MQTPGDPQTLNYCTSICPGQTLSSNSPPLHPYISLGLSAPPLFSPSLLLVLSSPMLSPYAYLLHSLSDFLPLHSPLIICTLPYPARFLPSSPLPVFTLFPLFLPSSLLLSPLFTSSLSFFLPFLSPSSTLLVSFFLYLRSPQFSLFPSLFLSSSPLPSQLHSFPAFS